MVSIYSQLKRRLFVVGTMAIGVALGVFYWIAQREFLEAFDRTLLTKAYAVSSLTDQEHGKVVFDFSDDFFSYFDREEAPTLFQIWNEQGETVFMSRRNEGKVLEMTTRGTAAAPVFQNTYLPNGTHVRVVSFSYVPRPEEGETQWDPNLILRVAVAMERGELDRFLGIMFFTAFGCWVFFAGSVVFLARRTLWRGLRPLGEFGEEVERLDASRLAERISAEGRPVEVLPIVEKLNGMLGRLEESFEKERRFTAAVAHELRTPLAELRSMAECAIKWPESREAGMDGEVLAVVLRMESMVERMLALSRGETGRLAVSFGEVEVPAAVRTAWGRFAERAEAKGLRCGFELEEGRAEADGVLLGAVLENLFDNAVEYSPECGSFSVEGKVRKGGGYELRFENEAAGLERADAEKMFDAFWRKDAARSGGSHSGLGLALARVFAEAMGWGLEGRVEERRVVLVLGKGGADRKVYDL